MEILSAVRFSRQLLLRNVLQINHVTSRNALDLAHKIHGKLQNSPPILVLHGLLGSKRNWDSMSKRILGNTSTAVVTVDLRNHGQSPHDASHTYIDLASDVSQLMSKLSISSAHLVGHSMGGRTGMTLALTEPAKVLKLVVVDISPVSSTGILNNFLPQLLDMMKSVNFTGLDITSARAKAKAEIKASGMIDDDDMISLLIMNVGKRHDNTVGWLCNTEALKRHFKDITSFPDLKGKTYKGPVLFIGGDRSSHIPPGDLPGIRELFPKAQLQYLAGGHNVHAESPALFLKTVTAFLK